MIFDLLILQLCDLALCPLVVLFFNICSRIPAKLLCSGSTVKKLHLIQTEIGKCLDSF